MLVTLGELLVEIVATELGQQFDCEGTFAGPYPSGAPAIFADQAARQGCPVAIAGVVGDDGFGDFVVGRLRADGVDVAAVRRVAAPATGVAFVTYAPDGSRKFIFHIANAAAGLLRPGDVARLPIERAACLHLTGSSLGAPGMAAAARAALDRLPPGALLSFDPNVRPELLRDAATAELVRELARRADLLLPSEADLSFLRPGVPEAAAAADYLATARAVLVKRGARGTALYLPDRQIETPAFTVVEIDPTGAGDCAGATFVAGWLAGTPLDSLVRQVNAAGALAVSKRGPMEGNSTAAEVAAFLASRP